MSKNSLINRIMAALLALAMMMQMMPGMVLTAYAENPDDPPAEVTSPVTVQEEPLIEEPVPSGGEAVQNQNQPAPENQPVPGNQSAAVQPAEDEESEVDALSEDGEEEIDAQALEGVSLQINGKTASLTPVVVKYGEMLNLSLGGYDGSDPVQFGICTEAQKGKDRWSPIGSTQICDLQPGTYYISFSIDIPENYYVDAEYTYVLRVEKGTLPVPGGLQWQGSEMHWDALPEFYRAAVAGYTLQVYKDGSLIDTKPIDNGTIVDYKQITNDMTTADYGTGSYGFAIQAKLAGSYSDRIEGDSAFSEICSGYCVPTVTFVSGHGVERVTPSSAVLIPGHTQRESASAVAVAKEGYQFDYWEWDSKEVTIIPSGSAETEVTIHYGTGVSVTVTAVARDVTEPSDAAIKARSASVLEGSAADAEDGICAYAFTTADAVSDWISVVDPAPGPVSFTLDLAEKDCASGLYRFWVKDGADNAVHSETAVPVTKITYDLNYANAPAAQNGYQAADKISLPQPSRIGWRFTGWYTDAECAGDAVTAVTYTGSDAVLYAGWEREELPVPAVASENKKTYDAKPIVLDPNVTLAGVVYQWAKYNETSGQYEIIPDAVGSKLECVTVADSGKYRVTVSLDYGDGETATWEQSDILVEISRRELTVTAEDKKVTFGGAAPEYTFTYDETGFAEGEGVQNITPGHASCEYRPNDPVKDGGYSITLSGFAGENYVFKLIPGTLTVAPKSENISASLSETVFDYVKDTGIMPVVTVLDGEVPLKENTDYHLTYVDNTSAGQAKVIVSACGNYGFADIELLFTINKIGFDAEIVGIADGAFWLYGTTAPTVNVSSNPGGSGDITYLYASVTDGVAGEFNQTAPVNAGTYQVKAVIGETTNYTEVTTQPVTFTIQKRHIIVQANSKTFDFDGMPHSDAGYRFVLNDGFAAGEGFSGIIVSGTATEVTDENGEPNVVEYTLTSVTDPNNYIIKTIPGKLVVKAVQLPSPAKPQWDPRNPGTATWVHTSKKELESSYVVTLYAVQDGKAEPIGTYPAEGGDPLTDNMIDLSAQIRSHADANNSDYTYAFTVKTLPSGGANKDNYLPSGETAVTGSLKTGRVTLNNYPYLDSIGFVGSEDMAKVLLQGEKVSVRAELQEGYRLDEPSWTSVPEDKLQVTVKAQDEDKSAFEATIALSPSLTASVPEIDFSVMAIDDNPRVLSYTAANTDSPERIALNFTLEDEQGLAGWMISTSPILPAEDAAGWQEIPGDATTYEGSYTVALSQLTPETETYYIYVKDKSGNVESAYLPGSGEPALRGINVYRITLCPGEAEADSRNTERQLLKAQNVPVVLPEGLYTYPSHAFRHWSDASGKYVFSDGSTYSENVPITLTAFWTDRSFDYTVQYFYMDENGRYADEVEDAADGAFPYDTENTFNVLQSTVVNSSDRGIQLARLGFRRDESKDSSITVTEPVDGAQQILKVYYAREQYTLTLRWEYPEEMGVPSAQASKVYYYGADISDFCAPKELAGFQFAGWFFGDAGSQPETMPASDVVGTGYFIPLQTKYHVRFYTENLHADDEAATYTEETALRQDIAAEHGEELVMNGAKAPDIEGFTYRVSAATFKTAAGSVCPADASAELTAKANAADELYINVYYSRNSYNITLNVWKGAIGSGDPVYTATNWSVRYGDTLPEGVENYGQDQWLDLTLPENSGYKLLPGAVWSTGDSTTMPAGDVVVNRQFVRNTNGEYQVEVWVETENDNHYEKQIFYYSDSIGSQITIGSAETDTIQLGSFVSSIPYLEYYEPKTVTDENIGSVYSVSGAAVSGVSVTSGSVTDTNNGEDPLVLRIFFERRSYTSTISYYAVQKDTRQLIATAEKTTKWGEDNYYYYDPLALFYGSDHQSWCSQPDEGSLQIAENWKGVDFCAEGYVAAFDGYYICKYNSPQWPGASFGTLKSLTVPQTEPGGKQAARDYSAPMGFDNNHVSVFYTKPEPEEMYTVRVVYNPEALNYCTPGDVDVTHQIGGVGTGYRVYLANEAMFYENCEYVPDARYADYPGLARYNMGGEDNTGKYVYSGSIRPQYTSVTEGGKQYYIEGNKIYIPVSTNPFFIGRRSSYGFGPNDIGYNDCVLQFLENYKADHSDDLEAAGARVYHTSFGSTIVWNTNSSEEPTLRITFRRGDVYQLSYSLNGNICQDVSHRYGAGTDITTDMIHCSHCQSMNGYEIRWYTDPDCTKPVADFKIVGNTVVYGKYEKSIYQNKQFGYFELPDTTARGEKYITNPASYVEDPLFTRESSYGLTVYHYDGHIAMVEKTVPCESFSDFSMTPGDFSAWLEPGLSYDISNGSNHLSEYCEYSPVTLRAYFARKQVSLTVDPNFEEGKAETAQYSAGRKVTLAVPERPGYDFDGWLWYIVTDDLSSEPTQWEGAPEGNTVTMPDFHLKAVAQWTEGSFSQKITHYFQNTSLSFATEAVANAQGGSPVALLYGDVSYSGLLANGIISVEMGNEIWYFTDVTFEESTGKYVADPEDLAAIVEELTDFKQDAVYSVAAYKKTVPHYSFAYALREYKGVISPRLTDTFENKYGMELNYYYTLVDNISVSVTGYVYDLAGSKAEQTDQMTLLGAGSHFYGERVTVSAAVPAGYDFLGWYPAGSAAPGGCPVKAAELYGMLNESGEFDFTHKVIAPAEFAAFIRPQPVTEPILTVDGSKSITYGEDGANHSLTTQVTFADGTPDTNYVKGYNWKLIANGVEKDLGGSSATFVIPADWPVGEYRLVCDVTVARKDNGQEHTFRTEECVVTIDPAALSVTDASYIGEYDAKAHGISVKVAPTADDSKPVIYYSTEPMYTREDAQSKGKASVTETDVRAVEQADHSYKVEPYTVYYYVKSGSGNYSDTSGSQTILITPVTVTLKAGTAAFNKVYDGVAEVQGSFADETSDFHKLVFGNQGTQKIYDIVGILPSDNMDTYIIDCNASFNSRHVADASVVTIRDIVLADRKDNSRVHNYVFAADAECDISGYIDPMKIALEWSGTSLTYTGESQCPTATLPMKDGLEDIPAVDRGHLSVTVNGAQISANTYYATAVVDVLPSDAQDYTQSKDFSVTNPRQEFTIGRVPITVAPIGQVITYDGDYHNLAADVVSGTMVAGDTCEVTVPDAQKQKDVGKHTMSVTLDDVTIKDTNGANVKGNYDISFQTGTLEIQPMQIKVTGLKVPDSKVYDGTVQTEVILSDVKFTTLDGEEIPDILSLKAGSVTAAYEDANVGTQKTVIFTFAEDALDGEAAQNYTLVIENETGEVSQCRTEADITAATVTVRFADTSVVYGETPEFTPVYDGFIGEDKAETVIPDGGVAAAQIIVDGTQRDYAPGDSVGNYPIAAVVQTANVGNYTFVADAKQGSLKVTPRPLAVVPEDGTDEIKKVYDGTYAVAEGAVTPAYYRFTVVDGVTASGIVGDDAVVMTFSAAYDSENVGTDNHIALTKLAIDNPNYELKTDSIQVPGVITPAELVVSGTKVQVTYGSDDQPGYAVTYKGFVSGETPSVLIGELTYSSDYAPHTAGRCEVRDEGYSYRPEGLSAANYEIEFAPGVVMVKPAEITVTAKLVNEAEKYRTYGKNPIPEVTYDHSPLVNGDKWEDVVTITGGQMQYLYGKLQDTEIDGNRVITSVPDSYSIYPDTDRLSAKNYIFKAVPCTVEVKKSDLTINGIELTPRVYDGTDELYEENVVYAGVQLDGLLTYDLSQLNAQSTDKSDWFTVSGTYRNKNASDQPVTVDLKISLKDYLLARYDLNPDNTQSTADGWIDRRPMWIIAEDKTTSYSVPFDKFTVIYAKAKDSGDEIAASGPATGETAGNEGVTFECEYEAAPGNYSVTNEYTINVKDFTGSDTMLVGNYAVTYVPGTLTVEANQLAAPQPVWQTDSPGKVSWQPVEPVGSFKASTYTVELWKNDTLLATESVPANAALEYDFADIIHSQTTGGKYDVRVKAVSESGDNVSDSGWGKTAAPLYAAVVSAKFDTDDASQAGRGLDENQNEIISINAAKSIVMIAGETASLAGQLKNSTGYLVSSVTPDRSESYVTVTGGVTTAPQSTVQAQVALASALNSDAPITMIVKLEPVPAQPMKITLTASPAEVTYGYGEQPVVTATITPESGVIAEGVEYVYTYTWTYHVGVKDNVNPAWNETDSVSSTDTWTFPLGNSANNENYYKVRCAVDAKRTDNGQTITVSPDEYWDVAQPHVVAIKVNKANFSAYVSMTGWTYGAKRNSPVLTVQPAMDETENPGLGKVVYSYAPADADGNLANDAVWMDWNAAKPYPTDAGKYFVKATIPASTNYISITTAPVGFTIAPTQLEAPQNLHVESRDGAYAVLKWDAVNGPVENAGNSVSASSIDVTYNVELFDPAGSRIAVFNGLTACEQNVTDLITQKGTYTATVTAVSSNQNNCVNSASTQKTILVGAEIQAEKSEKVYDAAPIVLTATSASGTAAEWKWFRGTELVGISDTQDVTTVAESSVYTCVMTVNGEPVFTPGFTVKITKRPVTVTGDGTAAEPVVTVFNGIEQTSQGYTVEAMDGDRGMVTGQKEQVSYVARGTAASAAPYEGSFASVKFFAGTTEVTDNYEIEKVNGFLRIDPRTLSAEVADFAVANITPVVYYAQKHEPMPGVTDSGLATGISKALEAGTDFTYSYEGAFDGITPDNTRASTETRKGTVTVTGKGNYTGSITVTFEIQKRPVQIIAQGTATAPVERTYEGKEIKLTETRAAAVTGNSQSGLVSGHGYTCSYAVSGTDASDENYVGAFAEGSIHILADSVDVTENYEIIPVVGYLKINKAPLTVVTNSAEKVYDGTALTAGGSITGFVNGESAPYTFTGSQTSAAEGSNSSTNTYKIDWAAPGATAKETNYAISEDLGTLTVTEFTGLIQVKTTGGSFTYDGEEHRAQVEVTGLPEKGYRVSVAESDDRLTHVAGTIAANCDHLVILNAQDEDVTARLNIKRVDDTLTITKKELTVTTLSDSRPYNGTTLTADGEVTGFVGEETYFFGVTGGRLDFGESTNTYDLIFKADGNTYTALASDYKITEHLGTLNVTEVAAPITITAVSSSKVYDGTPLTDSRYTYTEGVLIGEDRLDAVVAGTITDYTADGAANVVTGWHVYRDGVDITANYTFADSVPGTLTIIKRPVQITARGTQTVPLTHVYDGKDYILHDTSVEQKSGDRGILPEHTADVSYTISGKDVRTKLYTGAYDSIVIRSGETDVTSNYAIDPVVGYLRIDPIPAAITITAASNEKQYDGTPLTDGTYSYTKGVLLTGDSLTATVSGSITHYAPAGAPNTVAEYHVFRDGVDITANYTIVPVPGTLTITRREITLASGAADKIYNGEPLVNHTESVTGDGFVSGEGVTWNFTGTITDEGTAKNSFTYSWNEGTVSTDYIVETTFADLRIDPKPVQIIVESSAKTYGHTDPTFEWQLSTPLIHEGDLGTIAAYRIGDAERVGIYNDVLSATYQSNHNYAVTIVPGKFEITAADTMTLSVTPLTVTYDGQYHSTTATSNVTSGTTISYSVDGGANWTTEVPQIREKGSVTVKVKAENHNFVTATAEYTLTVNPAPVQIRAVAAGKTYGETDPKLTAQVTGMVNGESAESLITYSVARAEGEKKGTYEIRVTCAADQGNYAVTGVPAVFTIDAKPVTLKWSDDTFTYDGAKHNVTAVVTNPVKWGSATDDVSVGSYGGDLDKVDAADYTTKALSLTGDDAENYVLLTADASHSWTIEPRDLSDKSTSNGYAEGITVDDIPAVTYNGTAFTPKVTVKDDLSKVGGEGVAELVKDTDYTLTYTNNRNAGTATVTIKGIGNYTGTITKTFEIRKLPVKLVWSDGELTYNGKKQKVTAKVDNAVPGDDVFIAAYTGEAATDAGDYTAEAITLGGFSADNYTLIGGEDLTFDWKIAPARITITADDRTTEVGAPLAELTYTVTGGELFGDDVLSGITLTTTAKDEAGTYPIHITVADAGDNPNYVITTEDGTYTLTEPAPVPTTEPEPDERGTDPGDPCWIHWLIVVADIIAAVILLLTMKRKEEEDEQNLAKNRRASARNRWIGEAALLLILVVLTILGHCWIELPLSILSMLLVSLANFGVYKRKFRERENAATR